MDRSFARFHWLLFSPGYVGWCCGVDVSDLKAFFQIVDIMTLARDLFSFSSLCLRSGGICPQGNSMTRFDVDHVTEWYDVTITSLALHTYTPDTHLCTHGKTHYSTLLYTLQYHMISLSDISRQTRSCVALCLSYCNWL